MENQETKRGEGDQEGEINDSPIEQVRLTVPITDDHTLPVFTFRTWILGLTFCVILSFISQIFNYRQNFISIAPSCVQLLLLYLGRLMAKTLPSKQIKVPATNWSFSMNPGPFNVKEHVVIRLLATSGLSAPYGAVVFTLLKVFYHQTPNFWSTLLFIQTVEMIGYGFGGILMKFLVESPYMWYPFSLVDVSFFRTLHEDETRPKGRITKVQFFSVAMVSSFAYSVIPGYLFPSIGALSVVCLVSKKSIMAQLIGSAHNGLGVGAFTFDWNVISGFLGNPLAFPLSTILNVTVGFVLFLYVIIPIAYWNNLYSARRFPIFTYDFYDYSGNTYNVTRVLNTKDMKLDIKEYESYSKIYMSIVYLFVNGFEFACLSSAISHFLLFHARDAFEHFKHAYYGENNNGDVHNRLMNKYKPIPQWWFFGLLFSMLVLAFISSRISGNQFQLPFWGILLACLFVVVLIVPLAVLQATTGLGVPLSVIVEMIWGYIRPSRPLGTWTFKAYSLATMYTALGFMSDMKVAHYMKIPPRAMIIAQIIGSIISSFVSYVTIWWVLSSVQNICDVDKLPKGSQWTCPGYHVQYGSSILWGMIGPSRVFFPHGLYSNVYYFFVVGGLAPLLVWGFSRMFPQKNWIKSVNFPNIFASILDMPAAGAVNYWSWFSVGILFNFFVYRRHKGWWTTYNYALANGLDIGVALLALLTSLTLNLKGIYGVDWWGQDVGDHCPLATCSTAPGLHVEGCPTL